MQKILLMVKIASIFFMQNIISSFSLYVFVVKYELNMFLTGFSHFVKILCSFCTFIISTAGFFPGSSEGSNIGDGTRHTFPKLFMARLENMCLK